MTAALALIIVLNCIIATGAETEGSGSRLLAFPGADGFGRYTTGGRGGRVIAVTNLNDGGPGSLRAAIEERGPRIIIFRVSGTIALESDLVIKNGNLTIAGQTAPGGGICIRNYKTHITADNVIIRFLRFRLGDASRQVEDAVGATGSRNVMIDHCSMSWGIDEVASFYDNEDFTLQWSIISESLYNSLHPKGAHGYAGIWGGARVSFYHNLIAHHSSRNPRLNGDRTAVVKGNELVDFRNNVIYNWGFKAVYGGEGGRHNIVANYFKPGPATTQLSIFLELWDETSQWFVADNSVDGTPHVTKDNWLGVRSHGARRKVQSPFPYEAFVTKSAEQAYEHVLQFAGAIVPTRDAVDTRIVEEVRKGTATFGGSSYARDYKVRVRNIPLGIIDSQSEVGGWPALRSADPPLDADGDGIPDEWEKARGLNPDNPNDAARISSSGYSYVELYLNELAAGPWLDSLSHQNK